MDIFEKAAKVAKNVGEGAWDSAKNLGKSISDATKERSEVANLNVQKCLVEKKLKDYYEEIGRRYIEYMGRCESGEPFDISDILADMEPEFDRLNELTEIIEAKREETRKAADEKEKKKAQDEFDAVKDKLDRALELDVVTQDEYDEKLAKAQKKLDSFEQIRRVNRQLSMGIIDAAEYDEKMKKILD